MKRQRGFSLVELAIVLVVLGLLLRGLTAPLPVRIEQQRRQHTEQQLRQLRQSLLGYLVRRGHLPCPLNEEGLQDCSRSEGGVPAAGLGIAGGVNERGHLLDAWQRPYRYALSAVEGAWQSPEQISAAGPQALIGDLSVCRVATESSCQRSHRFHNLVVVVRSEGEREHDHPHELENRDADTDFVAAPYSVRADQGFDDLLIWISVSEAGWWLLRSGVWD